MVVEVRGLVQFLLGEFVKIGRIRSSELGASVTKHVGRRSVRPSGGIPFRISMLGFVGPEPLVFRSRERFEALQKPFRQTRT